MSPLKIQRPDSPPPLAPPDPPDVGGPQPAPRKNFLPQTLDSSIAGVLGCPNTPDGNQTARKSHFN